MNASRWALVMVLFVGAIVLVILGPSGGQPPARTRTTSAGGGGNEHSNVNGVVGDRPPTDGVADTLLLTDNMPLYSQPRSQINLSQLLSTSPTSTAPLHVCVVGAPTVTQSWAAALPPTTTFTTFNAVLGRRSAPVRTAHHPVFTVVAGAVPLTLRHFFGKYPHIRCNVSIVHVGVTNAVAMLRSVSAEPHVVLFANESLRGHNEARERRYFTPTRRHDATYKQYAVETFAKDLVLPSPGLRAVMAGAWVHQSLDALDKLSAALYAAARNGSAELLAGKVEGHSAQLIAERKVYMSIAQLPEVQTICEIGFNMGHSTSLWLLANPTARVYMFDMWSHDYSPIAAEFLRSGRAALEYGLKNVTERLTITRGSSLKTVLEFAELNPDVKCNILSVDGGHTYDIALQDIENMRRLAHPSFHVLFVDDTNCDKDYCVDAPCYEHERRGTIANFLRVSEQRGARGISAFQYHPVAR